MLISLLNLALQGQRGRGSGILSRGRLDSAGEQLADLATGGGDLPNRGNLPGGVVPSGPAGPAGGAGPGGPGGLPSPQLAQPQAAPGVGGQLQQGQQGQPTPEPSPDFRAFRGQVAEMVRRAAGGEIPAGAERWIREVTKDAASRTAGERGKTGFVGRLFGLDRVPGMTDAQSKRLRSQGLITAGLATMGANQQGVPLASALAQGVMLARADAAETAGQLVDEQRAQQQIAARADILSNPDLGPIERFEALRDAALASGDVEAAETMTDIIAETKDLSASELEAELIDVDGDGVREEVLRREDGSFTIRDPFTKEVIDERSAPPVDEKERLSRINSLADDFRTEASDAQDVANAVAIGLDAPANAAGDVTLLTMLTRTIDPGVSVREADIRRGEQIGGVSERVQQAINTVASSGEMSPEQREFIRNEIERVGREQRRQFLPTFQRYAARSRDAGVNPQFVVFDPFAPIFGPPGAGDGPAASQTTGAPPAGAGSGTAAGQSGTPVLFPEDEEEEQ